MRVLLIVAAALAAASLLAPSQPGYDPWMWLVWGRELLHGGLSTVDGPAWKPGPVLVTTPAALLGDDAAPLMWLWVARTGALLAVLLAGRVAWRLAPAGRPLAAVVAGVVVALSAGWHWHAAVGDSEGLLLALGLAALDRGLWWPPPQRATLGAAAALVRVEVWPLLALYGLWRLRAGQRGPVLLVAAAVPALWFSAPS